MALERSDLENMDVDEEHFAGIVPTRAEKMCFLYVESDKIEFERLKGLLEKNPETGVNNLSKASCYVMKDRYEEKVRRIDSMKNDIEKLEKKAKQVNGEDVF